MLPKKSIPGLIRIGALFIPGHFHRQTRSIIAVSGIIKSWSKRGGLMKMDKGRRDFLTKDFFTEAIRFFNEMADSCESRESVEEKEDYFESFEKCYPLLSEAGGLLMDEAIKQGVETKGKSKLEIAKEIFSSQVQSKRIVEKGVK